jgi:hypothetical protein
MAMNCHFLWSSGKRRKESKVKLRGMMKHGADQKNNAKRTKKVKENLSPSTLISNPN